MADPKSNFEVLLSTIKYGNYDDLAQLLELEGLDPLETRNNCLALICAIIERDVHKVKLLLSHDCAVGGTDLFYTPLHYAVGTKDGQIVQLLLEAGASIVCKSEANVKSSLYRALKEGQFELVDLMLLIHYSLNNVDPRNKQEFLNFNIACIRNNEKLVKEFIRKGINVNGILDNEADRWAGFTPLFLAVKYLAVEVVEILLKHKADFTFQEKSGCTPLHLAYYIWRNKNNETDEFDKASDIIDLILTAHVRNINNPVSMEGLTHFHIACMGRNTTLVYYFLQSGVNVNSPVVMSSQFSSARVPLHLAIEHKRIDVVKTLLENGANVNAKNSDGSTSLEMAYEKKLYKIAELLIQFNGTTSIEDYNSIFEAFADYPASVKMIDVMFSAWQENIVNSANEDGLSLLHIACTRRNIDIINKLLLSTSDVNACVHEPSSKWAGYTALHFAASTQNLDAIELLLKFNADVKAVEERGLTPLWLSLKAQPKYSKIGNIIKEKFNRYDAEHTDQEYIVNSVSRELKHVECIELLAKNKSNLNVKNHIGESLLIGAYQSLISRFTSKRRNSEVIVSNICYRYFQNSARKIMTSLIKHGIDLNVCDQRGDHVLHYIVHSIENSECESLAMDIAEIILRNGADVNVANNNGNTPLHIATEYGFLKFIELLLKYKANIDATNQNLHTPLHIATIMHGNHTNNYSHLIFEASTNIYYTDVNHSLKILEFLLQSNCNVNAQEAKGETALFIAANNKHRDIVLLLLEFNADINIKNAKNMTLLQEIALDSQLDSRTGRDMILSSRIFSDLLWHALKLIAIGHCVDPANLLRCDIFENKFEFYYRNIYVCEEQDFDFIMPKKYTASLRQELGKLEDVKIDQYTTLYDILFTNVQQMTKYVKNENLAKYAHSKTLGNEFPNYGYLLKLKFREGLSRNLIMDKATESFEYCTEKMLPHSLIHNIFTYITNEDMNNLILANE